MISSADGAQQAAAVTAAVTAQARPGLAVVGAGPAGLAAAVTAAESGMAVTVVDAGLRIGGQYWRHGAAGVAADADLHHDRAVFADLSARLDRAVAAGSVRLLLQHQVWALTREGDGGTTVLAVDRTDPARPTEIRVAANHLVLAVGAYDRQLPFPGWDLPGVMTVGAAQALLKGSGVVVGPRVLVAGTGPFLLPVAAGLAARGATVVGVHEAAHPAGWLRRLPALGAAPTKVAEAAGYAAVFARHRIPLRHRSVVVRAHGTDRVTAVTLARLSSRGRVRPGTRRTVPVDVLAVGYGFTAQSELPLQAACAVRVTPDGTVAVTVDDEQRTNNPRVLAAGEITGVGGAQLAVAEGLLAGAAAARSAGLRSHADVARARARRDRLRRFATAMHQVYPVPPAWLSQLDGDTVVCRCEEVTVADIDDAIRLGARDGRTVKLLSRSGMGWCQGRECGYATSCLTAHRLGTEPDLAAGADRPVATPVPLGLVARGGLHPAPADALPRIPNPNPIPDPNSLEEHR
ncbi:FAD/NAD(P)-dependent oxidoreductase [Nakamurella endophytica]|uniref:Oxidase n=1 Tax=Nakamurella endophytica TaxID=1748367 RepID=A0A917TB59_9ACTN|nr:NAD(P)/FAD-dependent oxidoreductase [Nakamurella endophytica]GGM16308.1 oxidase [Nakamurella endophytica]